MVETNDDYKEDLRELRETLQRGFDGVHNRLDVLNGRVGKGEVSTGEHGVRLINLEREVFRRRRTDPDDEPASPRKDIAGRAVTDRDVRIVWLTLAVVAGALEVGMRLVPLLVRWVKP